MAHLALTIDRDRHRRERFLAEALTTIGTLGELAIEQAQCGDLAAVVGVFPQDREVGAPPTRCSHSFSETQFLLTDNGSKQPI